MADTTRNPAGPRFGFDEQGLGADAVIRELESIARAEDGAWADGRCSGTIYCGDRAVYDLSAEAFGRFSYVNVLQRDMCPSQTRFESEIIAMTLDMLHGEAARARGLEPCGVIGSGGTESILSAIYVHREWGRAEKGIEAPEMILPETAHVAFQKGAHYFGVKVIPAPVDPQTTLVDVDFVRKHINRNTVLLVGSAGNYPYGTIDPIGALSELAVEHGVGLHVDGCLGGFILPWGEQLGLRHPALRLPASRRHHHLGGHAQVRLRAQGHLGAAVPRQAAAPPSLFRASRTGRAACTSRPAWAASRSGGLIAATWAVMVALGRQGYLDKARKIFETAFAMQAEVRTQPALRMMGSPTFCFSFTSDAFDIYHVNDAMKQRGWRFNGQQYPSAIHMCVTRSADPARRGRALRQPTSPRPSRTHRPPTSRSRGAARSTAARAPGPRRRTSTWIACARC